MAENIEFERINGYVWNIWHSPVLWGIRHGADLTNIASYPAWFADNLKIVQSLAADTSIHIEVFSPFTHLMEIFGYQNALVALIDVPNICHKLLELFTRQILIHIDLFMRTIFRMQY